VTGRISSRSRESHPNPEEPEEEDVQAERVNTTDALTTLNLNEKPVIMASCLHKEYKEKKGKLLFNKKEENSHKKCLLR